MEQAIIAGVAHDTSEAKVTVVGVPDKPGEAAQIFRAVADAEINIDMVVQNVSAAATGRPTSPSRCPRPTAARRSPRWRRSRPRSASSRCSTTTRSRKVSLVGAGMSSHPGVTAVFFEALSDAGVNVEMISTSEIRISVVCRADDVNDAVRAMHTAFGLDADGDEAVVYGGTGR